MTPVRFWSALVLVLVLAACVHPREAGVTGSHGRAAGGWLVHGSALEPSGAGYLLSRPTDSARWGTPTLVSALRRAAASVEERFPGGALLRVGDLSEPYGGRHSRHGSHQSGRDADVIFYATDAVGRSLPGDGSFAFDRLGIARKVLARESTAAPADASRFFDTARNWHFVRTLLADERQLVQWIFCSRGVEALLLRHALVHEPEPRVLARAAHVLHQPSNARAHRDHFHVRVLCTSSERSLGCRDDAPIWPWLRAEVEKPTPVDAVPADDATLVAWLLDDE